MYDVAAIFLLIPRERTIWMRLLAISDLHLSQRENRDALIKMSSHGDDWLIVAGDIAERIDYHELALRELTKRFSKVIWVPGNHDLWTVPRPGYVEERGLERYKVLLQVASNYGVITPEDEYVTWPGFGEGVEGGSYIIVPLFLLYDYSFRPDSVEQKDVRQWVREKHAECSDELLLHYEPFESRQAWCSARCIEAEQRLKSIPKDYKTILINHWPLRCDLIDLPKLPRFLPWCGTVITKNWHIRFNAAVVVTGHLHTRRTDYVDDCRFEEVSLGYKNQWDSSHGIDHYLREILPA
tara:strand:- start:407 stop:1294 length:888 start_codon:yes stop_codon:yes gene_type:complete